MPKLLYAADLVVSKLGNMFNEAIAAELPIISLEPLPGAEQIQQQLVDEWKIGVSAETSKQAADAVVEILSSPKRIDTIRQNIRERRKLDACRRIGTWLVNEVRYATN